VVVIMRLLFVSSTTVGGSGRSQRELATQLERLGHEVRFLVDAENPARVTRRLYEKRRLWLAIANRCFAHAGSNNG